jgi:hypothetical protein
MTSILRNFVYPSSFLFVLLLCFCSGTNARSLNRFSVGLSAQMLNTRIVDMEVLNLQVRGALRPTINVFGEMNLGAKFILHSGLGYSMMTQKSDNFRNNLHYLMIPVYFKTGAKYGKRKWLLTAFGGTNLHYLLRAKHINSHDLKIDLRDYSQHYHMDFVLGAGVKIRLTESLNAEVLTSFNYGSYINRITDAELYLINVNSGIMINLSYQI